MIDCRRREIEEPPWSVRCELMTVLVLCWFSCLYDGALEVAQARLLWTSENGYSLNCFDDGKDVMQCLYREKRKQ